MFGMPSLVTKLRFKSLNKDRAQSEEERERRSVTMGSARSPRPRGTALAFFAVLIISSDICTRTRGSPRETARRGRTSRPIFGGARKDSLSSNYK